MEATPPDEYAVLCEQIRTLLDPPPGEHSLERLEDTLTEGYARALALEAEQLRLERRIGELGAEVRSGDDHVDDELSTLAARLPPASGRGAGLRTPLRAVRLRADVARTRELASSAG